MINEVISANLLKIFNLGDKDEMSWKHLGHATAAIVAFDDHKHAIDYDRPGDLLTEMGKVERLWREIETEIGLIGLQTFLDGLGELTQSRTEFMYLDTYITTAWLPYYGVIESKGLTYNETEK